MPHEIQTSTVTQNPRYRFIKCGEEPLNGMVRRLYPASSWGIRNVRRRHPMELHTIGIDLGKTVFHLVGLNLRGEVVVRKKFSRKQLLHFTANLRVELIGMEACGGAHFLGRALREQGHEVRLMPAQYVKPYVKTNKSDFIDAEAIAEAVSRPTMRFVPIKTDDQLDSHFDSGHISLLQIITFIIIFTDGIFALRDFSAYIGD